MSHVQSMLDAYPKDLGGIDKGKLAACVAACFECAQTCTACAEDCESHASMHGHCRLCAEACRRCEQACSDLLAALG
ncbi:four-helix bundle copper-binding protein [Arthrobacter sp. USHLN218]|uniref:four-helix bundle copper-binding protein n=1 Tax=Arthrobacter sp. USHLN218 TaxID=3081232 RepID=UPI003015DAD5